MSGKVEVKKSVCFFCQGTCGVLVHAKDGQILKVEGNPKHPMTRVPVCERVKYAVKWLYHPDQLKYPMKRVGERGECKWERVSWGQALDEIAEKLKELKERYGPEVLAFTAGTFRSDHYWARLRFANLFGNPQNVAGPGIICERNRFAIQVAILGSPCLRPNFRSAKCIVLWGSNPPESQPTSWSMIRRLIESETRPKLIVIDPRITESARYADMLLQIRPGTDCALALSWLNVIINEKLYNKSFVEKWTHGFPELVERVQEYPPKEVSEITGIPKDKILESARMYSRTKPACIKRGVATDHIGPNSTRCEQARVILDTITGNLDLYTDLYAPSPEIDGKRFILSPELELNDKCNSSQRKKQIGAHKFKLLTWPGWELTAKTYEDRYGKTRPYSYHIRAHAPLVWRAILTGKPYQIKALITMAGNPLLWASNTRLVHRALKSENLALHVVMDYWLTPTAELADYVLPAASWLERPFCFAYGSVIKGGERAIQPLGERRMDYDFWRELGIRLGQVEYWPWKTYEELIEHRLKPLGLTYEELVDKGAIFTKPKSKDYMKRGFATPTGQVELYSTVFEKLGYDPLPFYEEPPESPVETPDLSKEYPLILNTGGRFMPMFHSEHRQIGTGMRGRHPDPLVEIHPEVASKNHIENGDWVWIETRRGKIKQKAKITTEIHPRVVNAEASWWFPEMPGRDPSLHGLWESNTNVITLDDPNLCDEIVGNWCNRALLCRVYKVG